MRVLRFSFVVLFLCVLPVWASSPIDFTGLPSGTDPNSQRAIDWLITTGSTTSNPNFSNETGLSLVFNPLRGQNDRDGAGKKTFIPLAISSDSFAQGQRFGFTTKLNCYGMGDCLGSSETVTSAAGVNDSGGEGTAFRTLWLTEQTSLVTRSVTAVTTRTLCNTTLTQDVTRQLAPQAVTVASNSNCTVGDWLTIDRGQIYWTDGKIEAVQITAVGTGTITGVFRHSHTSGAPVTPALLLTVNSTGLFGEGRYVVNLTQPAVTTGTVSAISGTGFTGAGTAWDPAMVGGDATLPGCISLTNDDYTGAPFSVGSPLKAWFGITSVSAATALNISHRSTAGLISYSGNGVGAGAYTVRPCARILMLLPNGGNTALTSQVVLETNTFSWNVSDSLELVHPVDADVSGELMRVAWFGPAATLRSIYTAWNGGAQAFESAFRAMGTSNLDLGFLRGFALDVKTKTGLSMTQVTTNGALDLTPRATSDDKRIYWGGRSIGPPVTDNAGMEFQLTQTGAGGKFSFLIPSGADLLPIAQWQGHLTLTNPGTAQLPRLRFEQTIGTSLSMQMVAGPTGLYGGRELQLFSTDYSSGTRPLLALLSTSGNGVPVMTINSINDATSGVNYGSSSHMMLASVWNGTTANRVFFGQRLVTASGTNAHTTWEMRAGTNTAYNSNPVAMSVRDDGVMTFPGLVPSGAVGILPVCIDAATGQLASGSVCCPLSRRRQLRSADPQIDPQAEKPVTPQGGSTCS